MLVWCGIEDMGGNVVGMDGLLKQTPLFCAVSTLLAVLSCTDVSASPFLSSLFLFYARLRSQKGYHECPYAIQSALDETCPRVASSPEEVQRFQEGESRLSSHLSRLSCLVSCLGLYPVLWCGMS